ncbi:hypothetical protein QFZ34_002117 [Phyllobacterium ifriqiyense]|uniref:Uncharacterized protein n=1 Tax=Phyllobacterium ifriqiyense TaxID=314238 RepID=A0ABU0S855_9HYPH|nr:hypothetical protein [Phyllobacterium ifriqiyense]MDQ0996935.1 hypothetical protein [Phyllobacterium ifriqiyense]
MTNNQSHRALIEKADGHICGYPECGEYTGQVELVPPPHLARKDGRGICIDVCLALEITELWNKHSITTTGCCCGHGRLPGFIGVIDSDIPRMKALGYKVQHNPCRPGDEDSFDPKTALFASAIGGGETSPVNSGDNSP